MQYVWGCQQSKLSITNLTQFVYNVGPARIEGNIWTCYETCTISTEVMVLIVVSCCFESNGSIAWPSHQSTAINKDGIWLKSICDKDSLECIILKILCSCITIVVRLIQAYLNNSQIIFSYSGYFKIMFNEFACVEIRGRLTVTEDGYVFIMSTAMSSNIPMSARKQRYISCSTTKVIQPYMSRTIAKSM